jgi:hypothetical protein
MVLMIMMTTKERIKILKKLPALSEVRNSLGIKYLKVKNLGASIYVQDKATGKFLYLAYQNLTCDAIEVIEKIKK